VKTRAILQTHEEVGPHAEVADDERTRQVALTAPYGTHSLRRSKVALVYKNKVALVYKKTGNLRACQLLLGHRKLESTVRYLGIEVDDALELSEQLEI
jgi:hypothetical protein